MTLHSYWCCVSYKQALQKSGEENLRLTTRIKELEARVAQLEGETSSSLAKSFSEAKLIDAVINT